MGRIVITEFVSLDGVMEDPGGSEDFEHGGWTFEINQGAEGGEFKMNETFGSEAMLLGRVTYEGFAEAWPSRTGDFADKFNGMPKYVASTTLREPAWSNTAVLGPDLAAEVARLKQEHVGDILVNGSVTLVRALAEHGLVDEYRLMVFPTVLGAGKRLFGDAPGPAALRLAESRPAGDTLILIYVPASS